MWPSLAFAIHNARKPASFANLLDARMTVTAVGRGMQKDRRFQRAARCRAISGQGREIGGADDYFLQNLKLFGFGWCGSGVAEAVEMTISSKNKI
jgi:hypothetical protein